MGCLRILALALLLAWQLPYAQDFHSEKNRILQTESPVLDRRLHHPGDQFLVDGLRTIELDRLFHRRYGAGRVFLWPDDGLDTWFSDPSFHSSTQSGAIPRSLSPERRILFQAVGGNEVGDPHLQELHAPVYGNNHTPMLSGFFAVKPYQALETKLALHQIDHFSYTTLPARNALVPGGLFEGYAWFGNNLPPLSLAQAQATWSPGFMHGPERVGIAMQQGWWWTTSPLSGFAYPWQGTNAFGFVDLGGGFSLHADRMRWESVLDPKAWTSNWSRDGIRAIWQDSLLLGNLWGRDPRLELEISGGYQRERLEGDSLFIPFERTHFPLSLQHRLLAGESDRIRGIWSGATRILPEGLHGQQQFDIHLLQGIQRFTQSLRLEFERNHRDSVVEKLPMMPLSMTEGNHLPPAQALGIGLETGYDRNWQGHRLRLAASHGWEWSVMHGGVFEAWEWQNQPFRSGHFRYSKEALPSYSGRMEYVTPLPWHWELEVGGNVRAFYGSASESLTYVPSPYGFRLSLYRQLPSRLAIRMISHYVGPKRVRHWSGHWSADDFRIPPHWEHNLGLEQVFLDGKLRLRFSALHLLGDEILEHPSGNPLRFRILVGSEAHF